ncbi:C2 family cysteine protease [Cellulomonas sp. Y8]|uniref:C2 family cysteine protease n=1 Tax=Cellulomonas sp. Y8 TaxID=2591145 RepID=UPI0011CC9010|nr:C2 family cysteine protease [Cellulomonas sp. Y8]
MTGVPGDPGRVAAAADTLTSTAGAVRAVGDDLDRTRDRDWDGTAADRYRERVRDLSDRARELGSTMERGARVLSGYAAVLEGQEAAAATARTALASARRRVAAAPLDLLARVDCLRAMRDQNDAVATAQRAAAEAAAALGAVLDGPGSWWDPFGWFDDDSTEPDRRVGPDLLDRASWDPEDIQQGSMGDCYLLAALMGVLNTDDGDAWVRDHIRWDADRAGYWITIYPAGGTPREVFVDHVFDHGATEEDWRVGPFSGNRPGIAALYEAAAYQELGYRELANGGTPEEAMRLLTGQRPTVYEPTSGAGYAGDLSALRTAVDGGRSVVAASQEYAFEVGSSVHEVPVTRRTESGGTETVDGAIATHHAYMVDAVDPDGGVWLRNPWGPGNSLDDGQPFKVSAEDFASVFYNVTVSEGR